MAIPANIAVLGDIVFLVTPYKTRTFHDFQRTNNDRWAANEIIHAKPRSQFLGPGLDTFSFTGELHWRLGLNPRDELDKLVKYSREGKVMKFTIGGKGMGVDRVKITGLTQNWKDTDNRGNMLSASYDITLEEYV